MQDVTEWPIISVLEAGTLTMKTHVCAHTRLCEHMHTLLNEHSTVEVQIHKIQIETKEYSKRNSEKKLKSLSLTLKRQ